jgi:hypothetical protein
MEHNRETFVIDINGMTRGESPARTGMTLFALSFLALFLELMFIRWVPAVVQIVAYYANLMLISSFLGVGLGALLSGRGWNLFRLFPLSLVFAVGFFLACRQVALPTDSIELRFSSVPPGVWNYLALLGIFLSNVAVFVPLGERIGQLFNRLPPLRAYAWDLGGSLAGTVTFGVFSYVAFSPIVGMAAVATIFLVLGPRPERFRNLAFFALSIGIMGLFTAPQAHWSPYHYITVHRLYSPDEPDGAPDRGELESMRDPPLYQVLVNRNFYQVHGTIDPERYTPGTEAAELAEVFRGQYSLPYEFRPRPHRVLVVGSGGGIDVEAALLAGAQGVDAVEIDPKLIELAKYHSASGAYDDSRVTVHTDDARAFFMDAREDYDVVVFGFLDSQALTTSMANIRLDGFVYTCESLRMAWGLLAENGLLSISFFVGGREWLTDKLVRMVEAATMAEPLLYFRDGALILLVSRTSFADPPPSIRTFRRISIAPREIPMATDNWPFLYLSKRAVPADYLLVIGTLLALSILGLFVVKESGVNLDEAHFFFLGVGFLLLETKSILDCSLYFGATWLVTTLIVAGVLIMVFLANAFSFHLRYSRLFFLGLFASFGVLYVVPNSMVLSWGFAERLLWTVLAVPLPIFFAGLIFSTTFRITQRPSAAFGANLIGATAGGFCEYLGMAIGYRHLSLLVVAAYLGSLFIRSRAIK